VRFAEINLFGVYVAPMSSMMGCRLGGDDRLRWSLPVSA
jgi:hypothetical protein